MKGLKVTMRPKKREAPGLLNRSEAEGRGIKMPQERAKTREKRQEATEKN